MDLQIVIDSLIKIQNSSNPESYSLKSGIKKIDILYDTWW